MEVKGIFGPVMFAHYVYLGLVLWSIAFPERRVWPPLEPRSWKYGLSWGVFVLAAGGDVLLMVRDWNTWLDVGGVRFYAGVPLVVVGLLLLAWGVYTLGVYRTSGLAGTFVREGPYRFTRNPQYVGDIFLCLGLIGVANSLHATAGLVLLILSFVAMPLAEELWLEEAYGDAYRAYKMTTPRFL